MPRLSQANGVTNLAELYEQEGIAMPGLAPDDLERWLLHAEAREAEAQARQEAEEDELRARTALDAAFRAYRHARNERERRARYEDWWDAQRAWQRAADVLVPLDEDVA